MQAAIRKLALVAGLLSFALSAPAVSAQYPTDPNNPYGGGYTQSQYPPTDPNNPYGSGSGYSQPGYGSGYSQPGYGSGYSQPGYGSGYSQPGYGGAPGYGYPSQYGYSPPNYGAGQYGYNYGAPYGAPPYQGYYPYQGYQGYQGYYPYQQNNQGYYPYQNYAAPNGYPPNYAYNQPYGQPYGPSYSPSYAPCGGYPSYASNTPYNPTYPNYTSYPNNYSYNGYGVPPPLGTIGGCAAPYPGAPGGAFTATAVSTGGNAATISWTPVPSASSYNIFQGLNGAPLTQWSTSATTTTTVPLMPGSTYAFQIHAMGPNGFEIGVSNITPPITSTGTGIGGAGTVNAANSTVTPAAFFTPAQIGTTVTVTLRDINRNPVPGVFVQMTPQRPGDTAYPQYTSPTSDPNGNVIFMVKGVGPGQALFNTTAGGFALAPATINFQ
jgi:hypothetical protein